MSDWRDEGGERIWRCECGGPHFVSIKQHVLGDEKISYMTLESLLQANPGFWERLKTVWWLLWRGWHYWTELVLDAKTAYEIEDELRRVGALQAKWEQEHGQGT